MKEDDFWSRPSKMDDSMEENIPKGGLGADDLKNLNEIQEHMDKLSAQIDNAKKEVIAEIEKQFEAQIDEINESKHKMINE
jgi:tetrahydromethanopterin S-methyltransferase subunit G